MFLRTILSAGLTLVAVSPAAAQWVPGGIPVGALGAGIVQEQDGPRIAPDGSGGAYVAWREQDLSGQTDLDIYLQHVLSDGRLDPAWPDRGVPVVTANGAQYAAILVAGNSDGAIVIWPDTRNFSNDVYAARILKSGERDPAWKLDGIPISVLPGDQLPAAACSDGAEGVYIAWSDRSTGVGRARLTHILSIGTVAPGWPLDGMPIGDQSGFSLVQELVPINGSCLVVWSDSRGMTSLGVNLFALQLTSFGDNSPGWPEAGTALLTIGTHQENEAVVGDGAGGAYVAWNDNRVGVSPSNPFYYDIYAQHVLADGTRDPRWPVDGLAVCNAPDGQYELQLAPDGEGGALFFWNDYRQGFWQAYGQRLRADGSVYPGWVPNGTQVSTSLRNKTDMQIAADGLGGFYGFWAVETPIYAIEGQHMHANGTTDAMWGPGGLRLAQSTYSGGLCVTPVATTDNAHGAYVAYRRADSDPILYPNAAWSRIYALRVANDGPVPTRIALADYEVAEGRVTLRWQATDAGSIQAAVERTVDGASWETIGVPDRMGPDLLVYQDDTPPVGHIGYRLRDAHDAAVSLTDATWITVGSSRGVALEGFRPNPAIGSPSIAFTLTDNRPATLQVHDVRGRVVFSRGVGSLGPGNHVVQMDGAGALASGMYWVRLVGLKETLTTKGILTR